MIDVSIIVPVYNTKDELLTKCITSILNQSYDNFELIIVDDGSQINTANMCDYLSQKDSRIKVFHLGNDGVSSARNHGISCAEGKYITFIDSDDYVDENYISILVSEMRDDIDCVICGCSYVDHLHYNDIDMKRLDAIKKRMNKESILKCLYYMIRPYSCIEITACWGKLYRLDILKDIKFNKNIAIGEDFIFNYEYFQASRNAVCINLNLYNYYVNPEGAMHGKLNLRVLKALEEFDLLIDKQNISDDKKGLICRTVNIAFVMLGMMDPNNIDKEYLKTIARFINRHRMEVIINSKARKKVRIASILSFMGYEKLIKLMDRIK